MINCYESNSKPQPNLSLPSSESEIMKQIETPPENFFSNF